LYTAVTVTVVVTGGFVAAARSARAKNETTEMRGNIFEMVMVVVRFAKSYSTEESEVQLWILIPRVWSVRPERNSWVRRIIDKRERRSEGAPQKCAASKVSELKEGTNPQNIACFEV
jgi:hypothetical protein